jgi:hypothetical protein
MTHTANGTRTALVAVAICIGSIGIVAQDGKPTVPATPAVHHGFQFLPGRCDGAPREYCGGRTTKEWTSEEISIVASALDDILSLPRGAFVSTEILKRGVTSFRRFDRSLNGPTVTAAYMTVRFAGQVERFVEMTDSFFLFSSLRDVRGDFRLQTQIVLHEFFHALDEHGDLFSSGVDFRALVGLEPRGNGWLFTGATTAQVDEHDLRVAELNTLMLANSDPLSEHEQSRNYALGLSRGFPSMDSLQNPAEAFAEIGSYLILDSRARTYMKPAVIEYFEASVFASLGR